MGFYLKQISVKFLGRFFQIESLFYYMSVFVTLLLLQPLEINISKVSYIKCEWSQLRREKMKF